MRKKEILPYIGKNVELAYINQKAKTSTVKGVVSVCRNSEVFIRGDFPSRRASRLIGGFWLPMNDIISLKQQEDHGLDS